MSDLEGTKITYEISKLTSPTKQIMDDFTSSVVMAMFREYLSNFESPNEALVTFMSSWEENIILQKIDELETLTSQQESMTDMLVGQKISENEDIEDFKENVGFVSDMIVTSMRRALR